MKPQTLRHQINAAIHVAKFVHRDMTRPNSLYKDTDEVEVLRQLRRQVDALVTFEPPSREALAAMQKWLPWDQVVRTMRDLRAEYETASRASVERARALMRFLMVAFYVYFPPVRAGPIRQLKLGESLRRNDAGKWCVELRQVKRA